MAEPFLSVKNIRKSFANNTVVQDFNLDVGAGEFVSFLGPSGCGKTTVLRMVAGFEEPTSGSITIGGKDVTRLKPNQRNIGMVFQAYALFPNLTVAQNIAFGLRVAKVPKAESDQRVAEMLKLIGLPSLGDRFPYQLSGGQQQRVALARALAPKPKVLLLDEPLSALDAKVRVSLREEIRQIQKNLGITTVFVTHDQEEALSISDRIVVMYGGRAEQVGTPFEIYNQPKTRFVASFVGTLNILNAVVKSPKEGRIVIDGQEVTAAQGVSGAETGAKRAVALRPEAVSLNGIGGTRNRLDGTIEDVNFLGSVVRVRVRFKESAVSLDTFNNPNAPPPKQGEKVTVSFAPEDLLVLEGEPAN
jgi:putative spermidine/putrescine transport system ATP-binding protein